MLLLLAQHVLGVARGVGGEPVHQRLAQRANVRLGPQRRVDGVRQGRRAHAHKRGRSGGWRGSARGGGGGGGGGAGGGTEAGAGAGAGAPSAFWLLLRAAVPPLSLFHRDEAGGVEEDEEEARRFVLESAAPAQRAAPAPAPPPPPHATMGKGEDEDIE